MLLWIYSLCYSRGLKRYDEAVFPSDLAEKPMITTLASLYYELGPIFSLSHRCIVFFQHRFKAMCFA